MSDEELETGYAFAQSFGVVYQFEHISLDQAQALVDLAITAVYVIETINDTFADREGSLVYRNKYFVRTLADALAVAAHMQIGFAEIAEQIVKLRMATEEETEIAFKLWDHFEPLMPDAIAAMDIP